MAPQSDSTALANLLAPTSLDVFARRHWDRSPLLVRGDRPGHPEGHARWRPFFSEEALDGLLSEGGLGAPTLRLHRGDEVALPRSWAVPKLAWGTGSVANFARPERVFDLLNDGFTLSVSEVDRVWGPLGELCDALRELLAAEVQCDVRRTPVGQTDLGLATYDVGHRVILQISGARRWRVHPAHIEQPVRTETCPVEGVTPGECLLEVRLEAGDLLYVPRGFVVQDAGVADGASVQLALRLTPYTWRDLSDAVGARLGLDAGGKAIRVNSRTPVALSDKQADWLDEQVEDVLLNHDVEAALAELVSSRRSTLPLSAGLVRQSDSEEERA